ncbi:MAG: glycosyltransferase family 39 protein [Thermoplasmatales archaeon]|nr:MAG: glycosyltransferase family 39 protein [Thermoplasmatales archaeon]
MTLLFTICAILTPIPTTVFAAQDNPFENTRIPSYQDIIDKDAFRNSLPSRLIVGKTYNILIILTNNRNEPRDFYIELIYPFRHSLKYFYAREGWKSIKVSIDPGLSQRLKIPFTPLNKHIGSMQVKVQVSLSENGEPVDEAMAHVLEIGTALSSSQIYLVFFLIFSLIIVLSIMWIKVNPSHKIDLVIALSIFLIALYLRFHSAINTADHSDEQLYWIASSKFINNKWLWPREYMISGYPPTYHYLLTMMTYLFGSSYFMNRMISVLSGGLTVLTIYFFSKRLYNRKVGIISALLQCFASYHIIYSGLATTDSLSILMMLVTAYFFWIGWAEKPHKHLISSGLFLGLSFNIKYVTIIMLFAIVLYIFWTDRNIKIFFTNKFIFIFAPFLITISPVWFILLLNKINPLLLYFKFTLGPKLLPVQKQYPILELIPRGFRMLLYSLSRSASPWLPWLELFKITIIILLFITLSYYANSFFKGYRNDTYVAILLGSMLLLLIDPTKHTKWLLFSFPYFFIMLSNIMVKFFDDIKPLIPKKTEVQIPNLIKLIVLLFAIFFTYSSIIVGIVTPFMDGGEFEGLRSSVQIVRDKVDLNDTIVSYQAEVILNYLNLYEMDIPCMSLVMKPNIDALINQDNYIPSLDVNGKLLMSLEPNYIIESRQNYNFHYNITIKDWISKNYDIIFSSRPQCGYTWEGTEYQEWLVFEKKFNSGVQLSYPIRKRFTVLASHE